MADLDNERFFPVDPGAAYEALKGALGALRWRIKSDDGFAKAVSFSTPMSGFSWGATMSAHIRPAEGGSVVVVGGTARVRTNITAKGAEFKNTIRLLDQTSAILQRQAAT